ncbi:hypothetical protein ACWD5R_07860 [Streptomyces sp. NPDC002514]|uniref:hypothetical protein n=1 Tax=Streptomyces sp. NPDC001270 TaxID=3364554 RepID=UPI0036826932
MTLRGGLLVRLWGTALAEVVPLMVLTGLSDAVHDGLSWAALADVALAPPLWGALALVRAGCAVLSLVCRARGTGIAVTTDALAATQVRRLAASPDDWARVRARLGTADRASHHVGGGDQLHFRWRPFRARRTVQAQLSYDEAARHLRIEVRAMDTLRAAAGLDKGGAFIALCQVARCARPTGCGALGEKGAEGVSP